MSLSTELSGVQAAQNFIDTVGNNVANVDTTGFKSSRSQFADLYGSSFETVPGLGVETSNLAQSFAQGQIAQTGSPLDVAISGNGFFQVQKSSGQIVYTRDGAFQLDKNSHLSTADGDLVLGESPSVSGAGLHPITINTGSLPANASSKLGLQVTLPAGDSPIDTTAHPFSLTDPGSYNEASSVSVYDSLGTADSLTNYYTAVSGSGSPPQWQTHWGLSSADGSLIASGAGPTLTFNSAGTLVSGSGTITTGTLPDGAAPLNIAVDYTGSALSNLAFGLNAVNNDGSPASRFVGVQISSNGDVVGQYANGVTKVFDTISLANFANPQGLVPLSGNVWATSEASGGAISGKPQSASFGKLQANALENSNVDLSTQLVNLIVAQQAYQGNVQGINIEQQNFQKLMTIP